MGVVLMSKRELNRMIFWLAWRAVVSPQRRPPSCYGSASVHLARCAAFAMAAQPGSQPGGAADRPTIACRMFCATMPWLWCESTLPIMARRWRPRSFRSAALCGSPARHCALG